MKFNPQTFGFMTPENLNYFQTKISDFQMSRFEKLKKLLLTEKNLPTNFG